VTYSNKSKLQTFTLLTRDLLKQEQITNVFLDQRSFGFLTQFTNFCRN